MKRLDNPPNPDAIASSIENDIADRNDELVDFVKVLDAIEGPYALLLDAPWGDGKTFFARSVEEVLKALNPQITPAGQRDPRLNDVTQELADVKTPYLPFYFNAWENDFADDPISALFANMAVAFSAENLAVTRSSRKIIASIIDAALAAIPATKALSGQVTNVSDALAGESLIEVYEKRAKLRSLINELAEDSIKGVAGKLVIIIDELDRCRPDFAVRLLEQTKSLFQSENIVVVISADSVQLAHAMAGLYGQDYDSQRYLERFFDQRLLLTPSDPYKVVEGHRPAPSSHIYASMVRSLIQSHDLTIRDYQRLRGELAAGNNFCGQHDDGSIMVTVVKCLLVPELIFLKHDDYSKFRKITSGQDFDSLYDLGSKHPTFIEGLAHCSTARGWPRITDENNQTKPQSPKDFVHGVCVWLYAAEDSEEYRGLGGRLHVLPYGFNKTVLRTLQFPPDCIQV